MRTEKALARIEALSNLQTSDAGENLLNARAFALCGLPYRRTHSAVVRTARLAPDKTLTVSYLPLLQETSLPFGTDRALWGFIQTRAFLDGYMELRQLTDYFRAFGIDPSIREYRLFYDRLDRLFNLTVRIRLTTGTESSTTDFKPLRTLVRPNEEGEVALRHVPDALAAQLTLFPHSRYAIVLDDAFHKYLRENFVALPLELMARFHTTPLAWDMAQFALWRSFSARTDSIVPWDQLLLQLGAGRSHERRLRAQLASVLDQIRLVYPDFPARFLPARRGLQIRPWKPTKRIR